MDSKRPDGRFKEIAITLIVFLLGTVGYLTYDKIKSGKTIDNQEIKIAETEKVQADLEKEYYQALTDLEQMKGSNQELNTLIESQKMELTKQKNQISSLLSTKADLTAARKQIQQLKATAESYVAQINDLQSKNEQLSSVNTQLTEEKSTLEQNLQQEKTAKDELITAKAALLEEKQSVENERNSYVKKYTAAASIKVSDIEVDGYHTKESGKEVKKSYAKNIEKLKICFKTSVNNATEKGNEQFFIRIINPVGETIAVDSQGSGVFKSNETDEQIRYTQSKEADYQRKANEECVTWNCQGVVLQPGTYEVEIYNKGYLAGKDSFKLK